MEIQKKHIFKNPFIEVTCAQYRDGAVMTPHTHEFTAISLILSGSNHETVDHRTGIGGASNVIIKPAQTVHNNLFSDDCTIISIYLIEENIKKITGHDVLKRWNWIQTGDYFNFLSLLIECNTEQQYYRELNSFLGYLQLRERNTEFVSPPNWIIEVKNHIESSFDEVIRSKELARQFKVHPVYLSRVFKRYFGQSIKGYVKTLRVNNSMAAIINEEDILAQVALKNGYSDQSHFNKNFKLLTGSTPSEFKRFVQ